MRNVCVRLIIFYQKHISDFLKYKGIQCKYYPSCSEYTKQAIEKYGTFKGSVLGLKRIIRCNPFSKGRI